METATDNRVSSLLVLYDMHTDYFTRALDGISDEDAHQRLNTKANHIAWIAGSLVHERYELLKSLGINEAPPRDQQSEELYKEHSGIRDGVRYPSLEVYKHDWKTISPVLKDALENVSPEQLDI